MMSWSVRLRLNFRFRQTIGHCCKGWLRPQARCVSSPPCHPSIPQYGDKETRTFNERAAALGDDITILVISSDLPIAQKAWCSGAGIDKVRTLSDHLDMDFGVKYGTYIKERRWHRRAVFVVDRDGKLVYVAYMPQLGLEPNYDEVLAAAKAALLEIKYPVGYKPSGCFLLINDSAHAASSDESGGSSSWL